MAGQGRQTLVSAEICLCLLLVLLITDTRLVSAATRLNLENYLQPDRLTRQQFLTPTNSNQCARQCVAGAAPKICYYKWFAEDYVTLGPACGNCPANVTACDAPQCVVANGYEKSIRTINRMVPGPSIQVCLGDRIIIDLRNNLAGSQLTIHWHGVFQQGTQYMDGVPMVTQCSVLEGDVFRYDFLANNEGTHYWHSHDGLQKLDGIQGNLVIRTPKSTDRNGNSYDVDVPEHTLMILDWMNTTAEERFPGLSRREPGQIPVTFLLEGRGRPKTGLPVPYKEVWVERGKRFRLRLVGGLCTVCGVQFSIEGHDMTLIATDGTPVNPVTVRSVVIFSGERYDVVVNANQNPGTYWIHIKGLSECAFPDEQVYQLAVLRYLGTNQARNDVPAYNGGFGRGGTVVNPQNATCASGQGGVCVSQLVGSIPDNQNVLNSFPDVNIVLKFGFYLFRDLQRSFNNGRYDRFLVAPTRDVVTSWMNNVSFISPPSPLLSQGPDIPTELFCPIGRNGFPQCPANKPSDGYCECVHVIKVPRGAVVQMVIGDVTPAVDLHHPFHLHGYDFFVMAMDQLRDGDTLESISAKLLATNFRRSSLPARKDTITVPSNGYAAIRFRADNPGLWFFHCHFMYHLATGMSLVLQVGEDGDWPPVPRNFPRCGNYLPTPYLEDYGK
uniref:Laccase 1 n=1 Tax=Coptotermes formosanus TaxID=36987 RepID=A0A1C9EFW4_COPFO|nr:laccase 1 [Coptotermes formosanus]